MKWLNYFRRRHRAMGIKPAVNVEIRRLVILQWRRRLYLWGKYGGIWSTPYHDQAKKIVEAPIICRALKRRELVLSVDIKF